MSAPAISFTFAPTHTPSTSRHRLRFAGRPVTPELADHMQKYTYYSEAAELNGRARIGAGVRSDGRYGIDDLSPVLANATAGSLAILYLAFEKAYHAFSPVHTGVGDSAAISISRAVAGASRFWDAVAKFGFNWWLLPIVNVAAHPAHKLFESQRMKAVRMQFNNEWKPKTTSAWLTLRLRMQGAAGRGVSGALRLATILGLGLAFGPWLSAIVTATTGLVVPISIPLAQAVTVAALFAGVNMVMPWTKQALKSLVPRGAEKFKSLLPRRMQARLRSRELERSQNNSHKWFFGKWGPVKAPREMLEDCAFGHRGVRNVKEAVAIARQMVPTGNPKDADLDKRNAFLELAIAVRQATRIRRSDGLVAFSNGVGEHSGPLGIALALNACEEVGLGVDWESVDAISPAAVKSRELVEQFETDEKPRIEAEREAKAAARAAKKERTAARVAERGWTVHDGGRATTPRASALAVDANTSPAGVRKRQLFVLGQIEDALTRGERDVALVAVKQLHDMAEANSSGMQPTEVVELQAAISHSDPQAAASHLTELRTTLSPEPTRRLA